MAGYLLRGEVHIQAVNAAGVPTGGIFGPINATSLELEPDAEQKIRTSNNRSTHGKALNTVTTSKPTKVKLAFDEVNSDILAAILGASSSALNQGAATVTPKTITLTSDGKWSELGHKQVVDAGFDAKKGVTPLVVGTDIEVNYALGLVRPIAGGLVASGGDVEIGYTALALSGTQIKGGQVQHPKWRVLMDGINMGNDAKVSLEIPFASLQSTKAINFVENEYVSAEFEGVANVPTGQTNDFVYQEITA